jgi:hypothetical protein
MRTARSGKNTAGLDSAAEHKFPDSESAPGAIAMAGTKVQNVDVGFERIRACVARMHLLLRIDLDDGD